jgi:signal transduction histidine kinase
VTGAPVQGPRLSPQLWRIPAWTALTVVTAIAAPSLTRQIYAGVVVGLAATAMHFADNSRPGVRQAAVLIATVGGLAGTLLAPNGSAEVATFIAASRIPAAFSERVTHAITVVDTVAVAAVIGFVSHSLVGLLAGLGIPLLVQRARERQELIKERDRAQALLVEVQAGREAEAQAVALRERGRIARDLHDVLAHTLAGLSVQLQGLRAVAAKERAPASVLEPIDKAAELARSGLGEARAAVGALRDPIGLGIDAIPALVQRYPGRTSLSLNGAAGEVTPAAGHAVYRAIQESLTNAARYAPGAPVAVALDWTARALRARICDTGLPAGRTAIADQGTGLGLVGMDERLRAVGGSVQAGPDPGGGWRVEITVPAT